MSRTSPQRAGELHALGQLGAQVRDHGPASRSSLSPGTDSAVTRAMAPSGETTGWVTLSEVRTAAAARPPSRRPGVADDLAVRARTAAASWRPGPKASSATMSNDCRSGLLVDLVAAALRPGAHVEHRSGQHDHHRGRTDQPRHRPTGDHARPPLGAAPAGRSARARRPRRTACPCGRGGRHAARSSGRVSAKRAGTSTSAVTITATTVIAVAKPKAANVCEARQPQAEQRDQHGGAGEDDRPARGDVGARPRPRRRRGRRVGTPGAG